MSELRESQVRIQCPFQDWKNIPHE